MWKRLKSSVFAQSLRHFKKDKKLIGVFIAVDVLLLLLFIAIQPIVLQYSLQAQGDAAKIIALGLVYLLVIIFIMSIARFIIVRKILRSVKVTQIPRKYWKQFVLLHTIIVLCLFAFFIVLANILLDTNELFRAIAMLIIFIVTYYLFFVFMAIAHVHFMKHKQIGAALKEAIDHFWNVKQFYGVAVVMVVGLGIFVAIYTITVHALSASGFIPSPQFTQKFFMIFLALYVLIFYVANVINRVYVVMLYQKLAKK